MGVQVRFLPEALRDGRIATMRTDILTRRDEILDWIEEGRSKAFICRQLKCKPATLEAWLTKMGISYSGNQGGRGKKAPTRLSALEYLTTAYPKAHRLRLKLIEDGLKEHRCEVCRNDEWCGAQIPLELHHCDGDRDNNALENLQVICPNCHAQTHNHAGRANRQSNVI